MQKVLHKRSNVLLSDGSPKLPTTKDITYGELAINYSKDVECLSIKNSDNEIVTFKEDVHVGSESDKQVVAKLPNLFIDKDNKKALYKSSDGNYVDMPPIPTTTATTSSLTISQKDEEVFLVTDLEGTINFKIESLPLKRVHIILKAKDYDYDFNIKTLTINFPTDDEHYVCIGYDTLTINSGEYGEIDVLEIDGVYYIQSA
jgi:hypothetical protein